VNVAEAGKGQVGAGYQVILIGGHFEYAKALGGGGFWVAVVGAAEGGIGELHGADENQIAHDDEGLAFALDQIGRVAGGVAVGRQGSDTGDKRDIFVEGLEFMGLDVGVEKILGELNPGFGGFVSGALREICRGVGGIEEEIHFGFGGADQGVGEGSLAGDGEAADVVLAAMGDIDLIDLLRAVAGGAQIGDQPAGAVKLGLIVELAAGSGVDQHQMGAGVNEEGVVGHLDWICEAVFRKGVADLAGRGGGKYAGGGVGDGSVVEGGDFEIADRQAVITGLRLDHGYGRLGGRKSAGGHGQGG
jgi:hypothetical protein